MVKTQTVTQNTTYYTAALVFQKVLAFIFFTLLARGLGVEDLGKYVFAFSFTTIFSVFVDLGMSSVLTREIAKDKQKTNDLVSNTVSLKIVLSFFAYLAIILIVNLMNYPAVTKQLVYITGLIMLLDTFSTSFWSVLRGNQNLKYESLGIIIFESLVTAIGLLFLYLGFGVKIIILSTLVGSSFFFFFSFLQIRKRLHFKIRLTFNKQILLLILGMSWPFALTGIFARLNTQIDTVFLSKIGCLNAQICETNVGIYSIASKITLAIHFIPLAFTAALFPAMSSMFATDKQKLATSFEKAMRYLMIISTLLAAGIFSLAPAFVPQVFGSEYESSILPLQILMASLVFLFITFPIGSLLNSASRQLRNSIHIGLAVLVNIILNLILIPHYTYTGAAIASFVSTLVILGLGLYVAPQVIKYNKQKLILSFIRSLSAGTLMAFILSQLIDVIHFIVLIPVGAIIYFSVLFITREFTFKDLNEILISLKIKHEKKT